MKSVGRIAILVSVFASAAWAERTPTTRPAVSPRPAEIVERLARAFNAHEPSRMAALVSSDFVLFYVDDDAAQVGARGPDDLESQMRGYFRQFPDVRSELSDVAANGPHVTCTERVSWKRDGEWRSQASIAVFDVRDGRIRRAWYFPAQR